MMPRPIIPVKAFWGVISGGNLQTRKIIRVCPKQNSIAYKNACFPMGAMATMTAIFANHIRDKMENVNLPLGFKIHVLDIYQELL
jgi:hypothetical protein